MCTGSKNLINHSCSKMVLIIILFTTKIVVVYVKVSISFVIVSQLHVVPLFGFFVFWISKGSVP